MWYHRVGRKDWEALAGKDALSHSPAGAPLRRLWDPC